MSREVVALHGVDPARLAEVVGEMRVLGAPTIRAIDIAGVLYAIEGTHRLAAAESLGIVPNIVVVADGEATDEQIVTGLDLDDRDVWTVGELRESLVPVYGVENRALYEVRTDERAQ